MNQVKWAAVVLCSIAIPGAAKGFDSGAKDLNPVTFKTATSHPKVVLVEQGQTRANIVVTDKFAPAVVLQLQGMIEKATGARLVVTNLAPVAFSIMPWS